MSEETGQVFADAFKAAEKQMGPLKEAVKIERLEAENKSLKELSLARKPYIEELENTIAKQANAIDAVKDELRNHTKPQTNPMTRHLALKILSIINKEGEWLSS
jgi:hypothetical protein